MNRMQLVEKIADSHALPKAEAARILETVTSTIVAAVAGGDDVQIVGFGTFKKLSRKARSGFNPARGEKMELPAKDVPKFLPGTAFRNAVNPKPAPRKGAQSVAAKKSPAKKAAVKDGAPKKTSAKK